MFEKRGFFNMHIYTYILCVNLGHTHPWMIRIYWRYLQYIYNVSYVQQTYFLNIHRDCFLSDNIKFQFRHLKQNENIWPRFTEASSNRQVGTLSEANDCAKHKWIYKCTYIYIYIRLIPVTSNNCLVHPLSRCLSGS